MLRIYFLQQWFNLSDPGVEEALYNSLTETTVCHFRHLLEANDLGRRLFVEVHRHLEANGLKLSTGTIVDATIIHAPSSTKSADQARDPDMHQTRKGNQWYFGMKAHIGVDSKTKVIHAVAATAANVAGSHLLPDLLHGDETRVWGDQAYRGQREVIIEHAPNAKDFTNRRYRHAFFVIKRVFGFTKVRDRGLDKNAHRLFVTCALANLFMARRHLLRARPA